MTWHYIHITFHHTRLVFYCAEFDECLHVKGSKPFSVDQTHFWTCLKLYLPVISYTALLHLL